MTTIKKYFGNVNDMREEHAVLKRVTFHCHTKRAVWNLYRRFTH